MKNHQFRIGDILENEPPADSGIKAIPCEGQPFPPEFPAFETMMTLAGQKTVPDFTEKDVIRFVGCPVKKRQLFIVVDVKTEA